MKGREPDERDLVRALRCGDEGAFRELVSRHHTAMVRLAEVYVRDRSVAEEVVQDAWVCLLTGLDRFQGRSSLRTWLYRVVRNVAVDGAAAERRSVPLGSLPSAGEEFDPIDAAALPAALGSGRWLSTPRRWHATADECLDEAETMAAIKDAIEAMPARQRAVIHLHDVIGCPPAEVCGLLGLSAANQRVLLHRARERVRAALDSRFTASTPMAAVAGR